MDNKMYVVLVHSLNTKTATIERDTMYGGIFNSREKAQHVCDVYNKYHKIADWSHISRWADFINVTGEMNEEFLINGINEDTDDITELPDEFDLDDEAIDHETGKGVI